MTEPTTVWKLYLKFEEKGFIKKREEFEYNGRYTDEGGIPSLNENGKRGRSAEELIVSENFPKRRDICEEDQSNRSILHPENEAVSEGFTLQTKPYAGFIQRPQVRPLQYKHVVYQFFEWSCSSTIETCM